jgi:hypothetical protein
LPRLVNWLSRFMCKTFARSVATERRFAALTSVTSHSVV